MSFAGITLDKLLLIALLAAFLIGPERLPALAEKLGALVRGLRDLAGGAKERMREEMGPEFDEVDWQKLDPRQYDPRRIVMEALRDQPEDEALLAYCRDLQKELVGQSALGEPIRAMVDARAQKAATKRWGWVKKGAPVVIEVGGRDMAGGNVSVIRRDRLYREDGKLDSVVQPRGDLFSGVEALLAAL